MTRAHRISNLIGAIVPFIAFLAAIALLWNEYVGWHDLAVLALMYVITGLGITVGYHRMLTHRSFQTYKPLEYMWAFLGSMAVQGPTPTPTRRAIRTRPTSATATASWARCTGSGTRTWAGCSTRTGARTARSTRATWSRTAA
jgi:hypothetical protein